MSPIWLVATDEWRFWLRSHIAIGGMAVFLVLIITTSLLAALRIEAETYARINQQDEAEKTFLTQPDRHPHRMVHYGHYLFRTPAPLAQFDPGLDLITGQAIFLEGHRQNTAMFAESTASADFGGLSWLSPALVYQLFAPLLIILFGHGSIARERETAVLSSLLAMGITGRKVIAGKTLALLSMAFLLLLPLIGSGALALSASEPVSSVFLLFGLYFAYLATWVVLTLMASVVLKERSAVLGVMAGLWLALALVLPSVAVNVASNTVSAAGKIASDLVMLADLQELGDGHNAKDPAFKRLRADLLQEYGVEGVEDLPMNFRGVVAMESEKKLTDVLNEYADARMHAEIAQEKVVAKFGWLSPVLAVARASRAIAGTDLANYHHFQRMAEAVRFDFVQGLNHAHVHQLSYRDDINRNRDEDARLRARVDASNWRVLDAFRFQAVSVSERFGNASSAVYMLMAWLVIMLAILFWRGDKLTP